MNENALNDANFKYEHYFLNCTLTSFFDVLKYYNNKEINSQFTEIFLRFLTLNILILYI